MQVGRRPFSPRMSVYDFTLPGIDGDPIELDRFRGSPTLIVNVASACGLAPQYAALQALQDRYGDRGLTVIGIPCNQFGEQEPGDADEIVEFCTSSYAVTFPLAAKVDVNGVRRHPLYEVLTAAADADGVAGEVRWNFEKFVVGHDGRVAARFHPFTPPDSDEVTAAVEEALAAAGTAEWQAATAADVIAGDRVRLDGGTVLTVTRVEDAFLGRPGLLGLVEDSAVRWLARPLPADGALEILRRP